MRKETNTPLITNTYYVGHRNSDTVRIIINYYSFHINLIIVNVLPSVSYLYHRKMERKKKVSKDHTFLKQIFKNIKHLVMKKYVSHQQK